MAEFKHTRGKRVLSGLGAVTLAAAGLFGGAGAAMADQGDAVGNIDVARLGSIQINKHKHQNGTDATQKPDGSGDAITSDGIAGVEFTAYQLTDIKLDTTEGWNNLVDIDLSKACTSTPDLALGDPKVAPLTDSKGITTLTGLKLGAYVICETAAPAEVVDRALPFLVTIPTPFENSWLYDVNVYPKNGTTGITKSIDPQSDLGLGGIVNFPVTVDVPKTKSGEIMTRFEVTDTFDSRLGLNGTGVASVKLDGAAVNPAYYTVSNEDQTVKVTFNEDGRQWLKTQGEKKVVVTFSAVVKEVGKIENDAEAFINTPGHDGKVESNDVTTNWGDLIALKTAKGTNAALEGAEFQIFAAEAPYADTCEGAIATGKALTVNGATTFTSGKNGVVDIAGLYVSDSVNDKKDATQRCYVLTETKAPAGFVTPTGDNANTPVAVKIGANEVGVYDATIVNSQQDVPELPLTGANGQILMVIGGTAVLLVAGGLVIVSRRRAAREETK
ncbi:SpaH/EbpB family LPXTG-anchored major pilin [Glutamicibacter soli]